MTKHPHYDAPINKLARDVAAYFDGTLSDNELMDWSASVILPPTTDRPAAKLYLRTRTYVKAPRVEVSIGPDFGPKGDSFRNINGLPFPSATFDMAREPIVIAKAIEHRIVRQPDTIDSLKAFDVRRQQNSDDAARVIMHRDAILKAVSGTKTHGEPNADHAVIHGRGFSGHVNADGSFFFGHVGTVAHDKALRIIAILTE